MMVQRGSPETTSEAQAGQPVALVVDLDETLSHTDTMHEALLRLLVADPLAVAGLVGPLLRGKPAFKRHLADRMVVSPETLAINPAVLDVVEEAKQAGREVVLVSASDQRQVAAVADSHVLAPLDGVRDDAGRVDELIAGAASR